MDVYFDISLMPCQEPKNSHKKKNNNNKKTKLVGYGKEIQSQNHELKIACINPQSVFMRNSKE